MTEIKLDIPYLEEAAHTLKKGETYSISLSPGVASDLMAKVTDSFLGNQESVVANIVDQKVNISDSMGYLDAEISLKRPITATIKIHCVLGNDKSKGGKIVLDVLKVDKKEECLIA